MSDRLESNVEQAAAAYRYYIKGDRTIAWDPASRRWVPVTAAQPAQPAPPLPGSVESRIAEVRRLEASGSITPAMAEARIMEILRQEI